MFPVVLWAELPNKNNPTAISHSSPRTRLHAKATFKGKIACLFIFPVKQSNKKEKIDWSFNYFFAISMQLLLGKRK